MSHDLRLSFQGSLTVANASAELARHQRVLREKRQILPKKILADLRQLNEVDTSALAVLIQLDREARDQLGQPISIVGAPDNLISLARLSSLLDVLDWDVASRPNSPSQV
jgi:ABC-type transporter Mla MlaB component